MALTYRVRDAFLTLTEDRWRRRNAFSKDLKKAHKVIHDPFATIEEIARVGNAWLQKPGHQPCLFGRVTAAMNRLHFCVLTESDLHRDDKWLRTRSRSERLKSRRRTLAPIAGVTTAAHGFVLWVVSRKVARAEPNEALKKFATLIRGAWGCPVVK